MLRFSPLIALPLLLLFLAPDHAQTLSIGGSRPLVLQGSTTFTHRVIEPYQTAIESLSGQKLTVRPSKSSRGILALFERSGDFAMISGPLQTEITALKSGNPDLPFGQLKKFNIANTRMAFAVNRANPVRQVSDDAMRGILLGKITNWRELGGNDQPIMVVMVREGGGVGASIEGELLGGHRIKPAKALLVQISSEVVKMTAMVPGALGLSQLSMVSASDLIELKTEHPIDQHLDLVTLGDPTPEMRRVIDAARNIMSKAASN